MQKKLESSYSSRYKELREKKAVRERKKQVERKKPKKEVAQNPQPV